MMKQRRLANAPLRLEALEARDLLSTFVVNTTNNGGVGSLRRAIDDANSNPGADTITFNIPGAGIRTIAPTSELPQITDPVTIDGYSQPGAAVNTLTEGNNAVLRIELNGSNAGSNSMGLVLNNVTNCTIRGLVINRFGINGIYVVQGGNHLIEGNFIGTDASGTAALPNGFNGVNITAATGVTVGGAWPGGRNLLSGNNSNGAYLEFGATNNVLLGNYIGTDRHGTAALANFHNGVAIETGSTNNTIGGVSPGSKNIISGNNDNGVFIRGSDVFGNVISRNYIGTEVLGTIALGNGNDGVLIVNSPNNTVGGIITAARNLLSGNARAGVQIDGAASTGNAVRANFIGTNSGADTKIGNSSGVLITQGANNNIIGGLTAPTRNVISGNKRNGIAIGGNGTTGNVIQGNYIGTDYSGTKALSNPTGVTIFRIASHNVVGGTAAGAGNVISGNNSLGVLITSFGATGNQVLGNRIGTIAGGDAFLPNGAGVAVAEGAYNNTVGGLGPGAANIIANNHADGVRVGGGAGNSIRANQLQNNGGLGINLVDSGNHNQPFPTLTSVEKVGSFITIDGTLTAEPSTVYGVDFYASAFCDPSGYGEAQFYLGSSTAMTNGGGVAAFSETFDTTGLPVNVVTATATSPGNDTSQLSACLNMPSPLPIDGQQILPGIVPLAAELGSAHFAERVKDGLRESPLAPHTDEPATAPFDNGYRPARPQPRLRADSRLAWPLLTEESDFS